MGSKAPMETFQGLGVADGVAIGTAVCLNTQIAEVYQIPVAEDRIEAETERLHRAVALARQNLAETRKHVGDELGEDLAGIFDAQELLLEDRTFLERVEGHIRRERVNAEWAIFETSREIEAQFAALSAEQFRARGEDLRDVSRHLLRCLEGIEFHALSEVGGDVVIVADDLTPTDAVRLGRENVVGFAIAHGSRTSHSSIIARSLNLPAVTGLAGIHDQLIGQTEVPIIVDGTAGRVIVRPDSGTMRTYRRRRLALERAVIELISAGQMVATTRDGVDIQVMANIDLPEEIDDAKRFGASGIGLYRSEFLYIEKSPNLPSEDEHLALYRRLAEAAAPHPAIIRTYDLGGRKIARETMATREENPVLGLRGIRLTLARPDIFRTQLRALLRAATHGNLWVMLPLVTIVDEVRRFRQQMKTVMAELEAEGLPFGRPLKLGVMIEVPSAVMISDILAREVDFFSIGTNDLIQYAMAVDRNNEHVVDLYQPLHPGLLRMLRMTVASARQAGIEVSLCGETGGDTALTPVLLGCGLRRLSVSPRRVPALKQRIRELCVRDLVPAVEKCCTLSTAQEVAAYLEEHFPRAVAAGR